MTLMPYAMDKGPYLSIVEDFVNGSRRRAVSALSRLRSGHPITELGPLNGPFGGGPYGPEEMKWHVNRHWFGLVERQNSTGATAGWGPQPPFDPQSTTFTGFWEHWYGDAEGVFRETMIRALEVALDAQHDGPPASGRGARHWHVSIFWNCPHPWYEGWVMWKRRDDTARGGQVTVMINTPAHRPEADKHGRAGAANDAGELFNSPLKGAADPVSDAPYEENPIAAVGTNGMWVVSQEYHHEWTPGPGDAKTSPPNAWRPPTLGNPFRSVGCVVTVAIAERDGGVLPEGRPYLQS